jgi:hypothetical protein
MPKNKSIMSLLVGLKYVYLTDNQLVKLYENTIFLILF